jgi:hypothetical protein
MASPLCGAYFDFERDSNDEVGKVARHFANNQMPRSIRSAGCVAFVPNRCGFAPSIANERGPSLE